MAKLTDKQLRKIHVAKEQGISKREVFEMDVRRKAFESLPRDRQEELTELIRAKKPLQEFTADPRTAKLTKPMPSLKSFDKTMALLNLQEDPKAKEAFLNEDTLRLQEFRARSLR